MITFECSGCKTKLQAEPGQTIRCSSCNRAVLAPRDANAAAVTAGEPPYRPTPAPPPASQPQPSSMAARLFPLVALALVIVLVGAMIYSMLGGPSGPNPIVVIDTSMGPIKIELFHDKAPISTENFLKYVESKHYDGTIFHRVMRDFMIQGGGFDPGMKRERLGFAPIRNESYNGLLNKRGTVAMARTPAADSATAQFYINTVDNKALDRANAADKVGYAVFGKVIEGMDVVDRIQEVRTGNLGDYQNVPLQDVLIKSVRRVDVPEKK